MNPALAVSAIFMILQNRVTLSNCILFFQTLGNHDFDDGVDNLVSFLSRLNFSVVVSNLNVTQEPAWPKSPPLFVKSKVFDVGGEKIGLVGYVLEQTPK